MAVDINFADRLAAHIGKIASDDYSIETREFNAEILLNFLKELSRGGDGSGTFDYDELDNRPSINGVLLTGDRTLPQLGAASITDLSAHVSNNIVHITATERAYWNSKANMSDIPVIPTLISAFTNDAGFITSSEAVMLITNAINTHDTSLAAHNDLRLAIASLQEQISNIEVAGGVQSDWDEIDNTNLAYIRNKPAIDFITDGDGDKFLSDDGTYKLITGDGVVDPTDLISTDEDNAIVIGTDDKLFVPLSLATIETDDSNTIELSGDGSSLNPLVATRKYEDEIQFSVGFDYTSTKTIIDPIKYSGANIEYKIVRGNTSQSGIFRVLLNSEEFVELDVVGDSKTYFSYNFSTNMLRVDVDDSITGYGSDIILKLKYFSNNN